MSYVFYVAIGALGLAFALFTLKPPFALDGEGNVDFTYILLAAAVGAVLGFLVKKFLF